MTPAILGVGGYGYLFIGMAVVGVLAVAVFLVTILRQPPSDRSGA